MRFQYPAWVAVLCVLAFLPDYASAETAKGQTVLASYLAPGQCAEAGSAGAVSTAVCAKTKEQDFHIEIFNDIAQYVSWKKIMNGKHCLQARYSRDTGNLYHESCYITTWSTGAFWRFLEGGQMRSEDNYCIVRKSRSRSVGTKLDADTCGYETPSDIYPAILTRSAKVGSQTLASYTGQPVKAIIVENGFSGGNMVASEGAMLRISGNGSVTATDGGYIIAGGSGYILKGSFDAEKDDAILVSASYVDKEARSNSPADLDFFTDKEARGKLDYTPH